MAKQSNIVLYAALAANIIIAIIKFIAALLSGSAAVLSEGIHSAVDCGNQLLLLLGIKRSKKPSDSEHPFGYGKEVYFWTLIVSLMIFILGGGASVYEGIRHFIYPQPLRNEIWNYVVLGVSIIFESGSFIIALKKFREEKGDGTFWHELHQSKDPALFAVLYEDGASIIGLLIALGVFLSQRLQNPQIDAVASVLVGLLIGAVAIVMIIESRNLLVGESARSHMTDGIFNLVKDDTDVVALRHPLTMHMAPDEILLALDVQFKKGIEAQQLAKVIDRLENNIRHEFPEVKRIFIEARNLTKMG